MTIKKRLAVSNVLMLLVPILITLLIAIGCLCILWFQIARGTGLGFEDSESFYQASSGISALAAEALELPKQDDQLTSLDALTSFLDRGSMSLVVTADGQEFYRYGSDSDESVPLLSAASALGNEGTVSSGKYNLHVHSVNYNGTDYVIYLSNTQNELSYSSLKVAVIIAGCVLLLTIIFAVFFTDRFLTRFVFRHVEQPLEMLSDGVRQISEGNLDHRLDYAEPDEFLPVCNAFNEMACRLSEGVERSRREEESRKELMASISHDLRSPLTSIQAYVEGLLDGVAKTPEAQKKYLATIKNKAEELEHMVARILTYSKLDLEDTPRNVSSMRLDYAISAELDALSGDYAVRGLDISARLDPFSVTADRSELRQLMVNIADNSLNYKTRTRGTLLVELTDLGDQCLLSFTDDGPGVPPETLPKLFDVFYRTDSSRSDRTKGSGLGLAIVEKTVHRMGGTVHAENADGGGLAILIELPKGGASNA